LASVPGSSSVLDGSLVAYANRVKIDFLKVPESVLDAHGAVSQPVVEAMAEGVRGLFGAELGLAASGVAGPDGGTEEKPVGTVWLGASFQGRTVAERLSMHGSRDEIRHRAAWRLIALGLRLVQGRL
jgi:PncC family amidohydrolase